jgi:hypothetical protein
MVRGVTVIEDRAVRTFVLAIAFALLSVGCGGAAPLRVTPTAPFASSVEPSVAPADRTPGLARLEPPDGAYFGLNLDWGHETAAEAIDRLGETPAVWVEFVRFPLDEGGRANLDGVIDQIAAVGGIGLITLEPHGGLATVTDEAAAELADLLAAYWTERGVATFVRFAHEMNGSWYAWGQQPAAYVAAFRTVATAVHERAPASAMVWAPSEGVGYPFPASSYAAKPGSPSMKDLDTDEDGRLTASDDPYAPYYPGDDVVDWVGMSLYHWGLAYPWGENEMPRPGAFAAMLQGRDPGSDAEGAAVPDFYATYAEGHDRPMAIVETAILFDPAATKGPTEADLKVAWFDQVFGPSTRAAFPRIGMLNWFEWRKDEAEVGRVIDWRLGSDSALGTSLLDRAPSWLVFGD